MGPKNTNWSKKRRSTDSLRSGKKPILWDTTSSLYKRSDLKPMVWEEIATSIGSLFTADMIAKRFKNMKETYSKNLAKVRASKRSGCGPDDVFNPSWYLYKHLGYLQKSCAQADSTDNIGSTRIPGQVLNEEYNKELDRWVITPVENIEGTVMDDTGPDLERLDLLEDSLLSPMSSVETSTPVPEQIPQQPALVSEQIPQRPASAPPKTTALPSNKEVFFNKRGAAKKTSTAVLESAVSALEKLVSAPLPTLPDEEKPSDAFCAMIGARLNAMSAETRKECENEMLKVLLRY